MILANWLLQTSLYRSLTLLDQPIDLSPLHLVDQLRAWSSRNAVNGPQDGRLCLVSVLWVLDGIFGPEGDCTRVKRSETDVIDRVGVDGSDLEYKAKVAEEFIDDRSDLTTVFDRERAIWGAEILLHVDDEKRGLSWWGGVCRWVGQDALIVHVVGLVEEPVESSVCVEWPHGALLALL